MWWRGSRSRLGLEANTQEDKLMSNIQMVLGRDFRMDMSIEHKDDVTEYSKCEDWVRMSEASSTNKCYLYNN